MKSLVFSLVVLTTLLKAFADDPVKVEILSDWDGMSERFNLGVKFSMSPGWYIYWRNPGDAGLAPKIELDAPSHFKIEEIKFPLPEKIVHGDIVSYGYYKEVILLIPVQIISKDRLKRQDIIKAKISWLACKESCVPGGAELEYRIRKATLREKSLIRHYEERIPKEFEMSGLQIKYFEVKKNGDANLVKVEFSGVGSNRLIDFYPYSNDEFLIDLKSIKVREGIIELIARSSNPEKKMNFLDGVIVVNGKGYELKLSLKTK